MLKIAIIGCGKVADQHVEAIHRIPGCEIVALCDREALMAKQLGQRFGIAKCFSDVKQMLETVSPDIVHITTPPKSHFSLAKQCLESGSHVYLEKPFTVTASETESLIELAQHRGLNITVGHNYLFTRDARNAPTGKGRIPWWKPFHLKATGHDLGDLDTPVHSSEIVIIGFANYRANIP